MSKGVKKSKHWCKTNSYRDKPIWEKFDTEDDKDKRVYLPEFKMLKSDLRYLCEAASRHGVSCSCHLETILTRAFCWGMISHDVILVKPNGKKRVRPPYTKENSQKRPRFTVHPSFVRILKAEAERRKICISLLVYKIFLAYRQRFPIYLSSCLV